MLGIYRVLLNKGVYRLVLILLLVVSCNPIFCVMVRLPCLVFPQTIPHILSTAIVSFAFLVSGPPFLLVALHMQT